jgi:hypothetical protein
MPSTARKIAKMISTDKITVFTNKNTHTKLLRSTAKADMTRTALNSDTNTTNQFRGLTTAGIQDSCTK